VPVVLARMTYVIDDESLVKTRTNTCLSYTSAVPSYSVAWLASSLKTDLHFARPKIRGSTKGEMYV
jgi:hypothetical protein